MKNVFKQLTLAGALFAALVLPAASQQVANHAVPVGRGPGVVGFGAATIGTAARVLMDKGAGVDPGFVGISGDCVVTSSGVLTCTKTSGVAFGTAATQNTGTSGATLPFLNGVNTWSGAQTLSASGSVTAAQLEIDNATASPSKWPTVDGSVGNGPVHVLYTRTGGYGSYGNELFQGLASAAVTSGEGDTNLAAWMTHENLQGGGVQGGWIGVNSPSSALSQTYSAGSVVGLEVDSGNRWADLGLQTDVGGSKYTVGLQVVPDPVPSPDNDPLTSTYPGNFGIVVSQSIHGHKWWVGQLSRTDAINPGGYLRLSNGGSVVGNAVLALEKSTGYFTKGFDFTGANFSSYIIDAPRFQLDALGNMALGNPGTNSGHLYLAGSTSGQTLLAPPAVGGGTLTLPVGTDTLADLAGTQTFTSKTISGASNTLSSIGNSSLSNSSVTIAGHAVSLGGTQAIACADLSTGATGCSTATGTSGATMPLLNGTNTWSGVQSVNSGDLAFKGSSSGSTTLNASAVASGTLTLPAATDTLIAKATTDTLTNKTFDTAGTGNSFSINGVAVTANSGTGAVARAAGPTFTTPTLGVAAATTVNKVTITAPATGSTLTIADGKTLTVNNSLTLAGTDATTETFPSVSNTLLGAKGQTLLTLLPAGDEPPATGYATWGLRNQHPFIDYTSGGSLVANWSQVLSRNYSGNGLSIVVNYMTASATSGTAQFKMAVERDNAGASITTDSFATAQTATAATVPGTSGLVGQFTIPISSGANMSSAVAGDQVRFQLTRGTDTATGDMEVLSVEVREAP